METVKKYVTEAGILSLLIVFCYGAQVAYQAGKLRSFGIGQYQGLVSLDFPSVATSLLITSSYVGLFLLSFNRAVALRNTIENTYGKWTVHIMNSLILTILLCIYMLPIFLAITASQAEELSTLLSAGYLVICLLLGTWMEIITSLKKSFGRQMFPEITSLTLRYNLKYIIFPIVLTPLYAYSVGYSSPRISTFNDSMSIDGKNYIIADFNLDHAVLVRVEGKTLKQEYSIRKISEGSGLSFKTMEGKLDFTEIKNRLFPTI